MTDFPAVSDDPHFWLGYLAGELTENYARTGDKGARDTLIQLEAAGGLSDRMRTRLRLRMQADLDRFSDAFVCNPDESCGYDTSDPKHPDWHSVHADVWDNREKGV